MRQLLGEVPSPKLCRRHRPYSDNEPSAKVFTSRRGPISCGPSKAKSLLVALAKVDEPWLSYRALRRSCFVACGNTREPLRMPPPVLPLENLRLRVKRARHHRDFSLPDTTGVASLRRASSGSVRRHSRYFCSSNSCKANWTVQGNTSLRSV